jgi:LacI family transcriptional regulator, galactose operon repressor
MKQAGRQHKATLVDVAELAQVDRSVVSRVLSDDPKLNIRGSTRERVLRAVAELNYRPNAIARSLRTSRAGVIGLLIPDFANPVYASIIKGAEAAAARSDRLLLTGSLSEGSFEVAQYVELLAQGRVDGLLLAGMQTRGRTIDRAQAFEQLNMVGMPWILLNEQSPLANRYIVFDDERAAALAVEHLIELGHRRIAHIAGPSSADTAQRRRAGYLEAMASAGLNSDGELIVQADYTNAGGVTAMQALLKAPDPPTAVFVSNVASAIGALYAIRQANLIVPDDISVVAIHDLPLANYLAPPLTTVRMPLEELGRRGVEFLSAVSATEPIEEVVAEPMDLIIRESTGRPRRESKSEIIKGEHR